MNIITVTVANGSNLSVATQMAADIQYVKQPQYLTGLYIPTIDAAIVYLRASVDRINFARMLKTDGSGDWNVAIGTGDRWIFLDQLAPFPYIQIELSANQTADRVFKFVQDVIM